jgi:NAD-dependent DNA ligase
MVDDWVALKVDKSVARWVGGSVVTSVVLKVDCLVLLEVGLKAGSKAGKTAEQSVGSKVVELADL